jgi:ppGpp synthetase/RelA/SpoT-type nucleotidyltranferase
MARHKLTAAENAEIERAVSYFQTCRDRFLILAQNLINLLVNDTRLQALIHSSKSRVKDPSHLRDKLVRKALEAKVKGLKPDIDKDNLFVKIGDLAGVRLLHLHTQQFAAIHATIDAILSDQLYVIVEGPIAHTWDNEYSEFFKSLGIGTASRPSLYTSVHYVIEPNSRTKLRCELQVRTLMEEVWGEVSHTINYPHETGSIACKEQLKVLARLTSACTRSVDSIFQTKTEYDDLTK